MAFEIKSLEDVYKFSLPLYDYLKNTGHKDITYFFEDLVDSCFESEADSIVAHRKAFIKVLEEVDDLPDEYKMALEDAVEMLK